MPNFLNFAKVCYLIILLVLLWGCQNQKTKWITKETDYFSFSIPDTMKVEDIKWKPLQYKGELLGPSLWIRGEIQFEEFTISFAIDNPENQKVKPEVCSNHSVEVMEEYGELFSINNQDYVLVSFSIQESEKHNLDLCIDTKHAFYCYEVNKEYLSVAEKIFKSIKIL